MILVDSDILVWILMGKREIKERFKKTAAETDGTIYLTPIQIAEIYGGIRENERTDTEIFLNSFMILNIDQGIGKLAGDFINRYRKSHHLTLADAMIAATAKIHGLTLWTLNKKHYPMLEDRDFYA